MQANRKELAIKESHPDRDKQFEYINKQAKAFILKPEQELLKTSSSDNTKLGEEKTITANDFRMPPPFVHVGIHFSLFDTVKPSKQALNRYAVQPIQKGLFLFQILRFVVSGIPILYGKGLLHPNRKKLLAGMVE
jgi:hypothetical protein